MYLWYFIRFECVVPSILIPNSKHITYVFQEATTCYLTQCDMYKIRVVLQVGHKALALRFCINKSV